ncbi:MAG: PIN domain-containing protein [Candidatus Methanofastidiosia archaeon]
MSDIPKDSLVFIDSNIFLYFILEHPLYFNSCRNFLERVEKGEIMGFINSIVFSETYFTYMKIQIKETCDITLRKVFEFIKKDPAIIKTIDTEPVDMVFKMPNMYLITVLRETLDLFGNFISKYTLLPNDTLHALTCFNNKIRDIATNDSDFERVDFLKIWKPKS